MPGSATWSWKQKKKMGNSGSVFIENLDFFVFVVVHHGYFCIHFDFFGILHQNIIYIDDSVFWCPLKFCTQRRVPYLAHLTLALALRKQHASFHWSGGGSVLLYLKNIYLYTTCTTATMLLWYWGWNWD